MKIRRVHANNRTHAFELETPRGSLNFPYARVSPKPSADDRITRVFVRRRLSLGHNHPDQECAE